MLPFLKDPNKMVTTLMDRRGKRAEIQPEIESKSHPDHSEELEAAAQSLLSAIQSKSIQGIRDALRDAHIACDKELHQEGPHINDESEEPAE